MSEAAKLTIGRSTNLPGTVVDITCPHGSKRCVLVDHSPTPLATLLAYAHSQYWERRSCTCDTRAVLDVLAAMSASGEPRTEDAHEEQRRRAVARMRIGNIDHFADRARADLDTLGAKLPKNDTEAWVYAATILERLVAAAKTTADVLAELTRKTDEEIIERLRVHELRPTGDPDVPAV